MNERRSLSTNPSACYANLKSYAVNGQFRQTIINPTPATINPTFFQDAQPYKLNISSTPDFVSSYKVGQNSTNSSC